MRKLWAVGFIFLLIVSCRQGENKNLNAAESELEFNNEDLPKRVNLNPRSNNIVQDWAEYNAFDTSFDAIYNATNNEDLILAIEDLIEKQKLWEDSTYPEGFDKPQIKSRQKVLKTYILKVKTALEFRTDISAATVDMIEAYNALRFQFDVIMNSTLDPKLLLDEE